MAPLNVKRAGYSPAPIWAKMGPGQAPVIAQPIPNSKPPPIKPLLNSFPLKFNSFFSSDFALNFFSKKIEKIPTAIAEPIIKNI